MKLPMVPTPVQSPSPPKIRTYHRYIVILLILMCYGYMIYHFPSTSRDSTLSSFCSLSSLVSSSAILPEWSTTGTSSTSQSSSSGASTRGVCQTVFGNTLNSFQKTWEQHIKDMIRNVSLMQTEWSYDLRSNPEFTLWVQDSMEYFTYHRLQRTKMSLPIDQTNLFRRIYQIIETKMQHINNIDNNNTMPPPPPLHIVVFGGSVTTGHDCFDNIYDFSIRRDGKDNSRKNSTDEERKLCAWPGRLQDMFNVLFGNGTILVTNLAIGGVATDITTSVLEFGLLPPDHSPDIVIWDHGTNDGLAPITESILADSIFQKLQSFYQATINLPRKDPPLLILLDSFLGQERKLPILSHSLAASSAVSKMLSWYPNIWGMSYANAVRPYLYSHLTDRYASLPLIATKGLVAHPGMMYHISVAWTIAFNFVQALHNQCVFNHITEQQRQELQTKRQFHQQQQTHANYISSERRLSQFTTSSIEPLQSTKNDYYHDSIHIPELTKDLHPLDISSEWEKRVSSRNRSSNKNRVPLTIASTTTSPDNRAAINDLIETTTTTTTKHSSMNCYYAWMVNKILRIQTPTEIAAALYPYMIRNRGWTSRHEDKVRSPGLVAQSGTGSIFVLQFDDIPLTVDSLTLIYMVSYSEKWHNSTLRIDSTFVDTILPIGNEKNMTSIATTNTTMKHIVSGYHDNESSILVPVKLSLKNTTTTRTESFNVNRQLRIQFQLIGGETFKIAGMAIC